VQDVWQVEVAVKHGVDIVIKNARVLTVRKEFFLINVIIRNNAGFYVFLPFHNLRWYRKQWGLEKLLTRMFVGTSIYCSHGKKSSILLCQGKPFRS
jgi:hypothetical protein